MLFTVYNETTGEIYRTGICPAEDFERQGDGYSVAEGTYPDNEYYWDNGFVPMPPKPEGYYDFDYATKTWVLNEPQTIAANKAKRDNLLKQSDWTQLPDVPLTEEQKAAWATYRQELRDMTDSDFLNGNFPTPPTN